MLDLNCEKFFCLLNLMNMLYTLGILVYYFLLHVLPCQYLIFYIIMFMDLQMYKNHDSTSPYIPDMETGLYTLMIINGIM